jgi:hypothetical protein
MFEVLSIFVDGRFGEFLWFSFLVEGFDDFGGLLGLVVLALWVHGW